MHDSMSSQLSGHPFAALCSASSDDAASLPESVLQPVSEPAKAKKGAAKAAAKPKKTTAKPAAKPAKAKAAKAPAKSKKTSSTAKKPKAAKEAKPDAVQAKESATAAAEPATVVVLEPKADAPRKKVVGRSFLWSGLCRIFVEKDAGITTFSHTGERYVQTHIVVAKFRVEVRIRGHEVAKVARGEPLVGLLAFYEKRFSDGSFSVFADLHPVNGVEPAFHLAQLWNEPANAHPNRAALVKLPGSGFIEAYAAANASGLSIAA